MPRERTHIRYQLYKSSARSLAATSAAELQRELEWAGPTYIDLSRVRFEPINAQALDACERWEDSHFLWSEIIGWKAKEPWSLDIAIWFEEELCGLCFANPNNSRQRIRIVRLEGSPREAHPLKNRIAALAISAIEHYALIIGSRFIDVQEPLEGAIPIYKRLDFNEDTEGRLVRTVESLVS
ncbi:hypothetical protein [Pseudomonas sp. NPDC086278]|uniref:hypothetical protein n=1 Tax=Pseudomonas sp. NPDC086278 TaxID=3390646 RepID=UPI003D0446F0